MMRHRKWVCVCLSAARVKGGLCLILGGCILIAICHWLIFPLHNSTRINSNQLSVQPRISQLLEEKAQRQDLSSSPAARSIWFNLIYFVIAESPKMLAGLILRAMLAIFSCFSPPSKMRHGSLLRGQPIVKW